jgi:hypothetical protein
MTLRQSSKYRILLVQRQENWANRSASGGLKSSIRGPTIFGRSMTTTNCAVLTSKSTLVSTPIRGILFGATLASAMAHASAISRRFEGAGWCPRFIRSDGGSEVVLLADAHYRLFLQHQTMLNVPEEALADIGWRECFLFGPSTANTNRELVAAFNQLSNKQWMASWRSNCSF